MMRPSPKPILAALLLNLIAGPVLAQEGACDTRSPHYPEGDDAYFDLEPETEPTPDEISALSGFFQSLSGQWVGNLIHHECKGAQGRARAVYDRAQVEAHISEIGWARLQMAYEAEYPEDRKTRLQKLGTAGPESIFSLSGPNAGQLQLTEKYQRRSAQGGSIMVENIYAIRHNGDRLDITLTAYLNGFFGWRDQFSLQLEP